MPSIFRTSRPQQYKYTPRYYDPAKEDLKERLERATPNKDKDMSPEAMKARIRTGFKSPGSLDRKFRRRQSKRTNYRVAAIALVLTLFIALLIVRNWSAIEEFIQ